MVGYLVGCAWLENISIEVSRSSSSISMAGGELEGDVEEREMREDEIRRVVVVILRRFITWHVM